MGGFLVCPRTPNLPSEEVDEKYRKSLEVFEKKGLALDCRLVRDNFIAYRFRKIFEPHGQVLELAGGDFVLSVGMMQYAGKVGLPALQQLYDDFVSGTSIDSKIAGNYSVAIHSNSALHVIRDYAGYYPVYCNTEKSLISSSFLAVARGLPVRAPAAQELYEYMLHGFFVHDTTCVPQVDILDCRKMWRVRPETRVMAREPPFKPIPAAATFQDVAQLVGDELLDYFEMLNGNSEGPIGTALSGGFDTRLMLALIRYIGRTPSVYVYGGADSSDVVVAKQICAGENLPVEHVDKGALPHIGPDEFAAVLERDVFFFDGIKPLGLIDDGNDLATRLDRARKSQLQLNGAGGEIYREIWNLPDRRVGLDTFLRMRYDRGFYPYFRAPFDADAYFARFANKMRDKLGLDRDWLERREAEILFPDLRNLFAAPNNAANAQICYSLIPFMEPRFTLPSYDIPIRFKYEGRLQAELIKRFDPALARYMSSYGLNFFDPIPVSYRLRRFVERYVPLRARIMRRRRMALQLATSWPYYLSNEYLSEAFDLDNLRVAEFVDVSKVGDPELLSRILSVELLLSHL